MKAEIIVRIDGREVKRREATLDGSAENREERSHQIGREVGRSLTEAALNDLAKKPETFRPHCCGRPMHRKGLRARRLTARDGRITVRRLRYRCGRCGRESYPADEGLTCGGHAVTRPLAKRICQLATLEHFPRLPQLVFDQHGVRLSGEAIHQLVTDVGTQADRWRRAESQACRQTPGQIQRWPEPEVKPRRVYVSCDGICYCTNQREPDPGHPGRNRLVWQEMKVGCVYWEDDRGRWRKQMIWGREPPEEFGQALYGLACRCGYREAEEKLFAADGADWCWTIRQTYFADAAGILDWYHASEHVWDCGKALHAEKDTLRAWVDEALDRLRSQGGEGLLPWLLSERTSRRGRKRQALDSLIRYLQPRLDRTDYPMYRSRGWQIGTGMIESTAKQLVGMRLKGPGMHWSEQGALAVTALRAHDLNHNWHRFWSTLVMAP